MSKLVPEAHVQADDVEWRPWVEGRSTPFLAEGARGAAWVKVLSRDPATEAESLLYKLDRGWSADRIRNTVYENLMVIDGEIEVDGEKLRKYAFSYRPEGHELGPVSTETGATVVAFAGAPGELASKEPIACLDVESMPWVSRDISVVQDGVQRGKYVTKPTYYMKMLRGDEENLDTFSLMRAVRGFVSDGVSSHAAPEEGYTLEGHYMFYDGVTDGRCIGRRGTYIHRGPGSKHGFVEIEEDSLTFKHDYFNAEDDLELFYASYPKETPAVKALKEGKDPGLPQRW
jgi:Domain of unknown function (DUF4437)